MPQVCVIFDMDGVLADTGPVHFQSWKKLADEIGVEFTKELFEKTFGQKSVPIIRRLVGEDGVDEQLQKWADLKEKYYREMVKDKIKPLEGVIPLIKDLKRHNCKLAVASSGPPENVELLVDSLKLREFFDELITAEDVKKGKPEPDAFLIAAQKLKVNPEDCVVIEDAPVGIEAAKRARMKRIALTTTHPREELQDANLILSDLSDITYEEIMELLKS
jgi:beta-phosphoglucomutase family hydrolase